MSGQDVEYVVDLGLLKQAANGALSIANPIYQGVIPRALSWKFQAAVIPQRRVYVDENGRLRMDWLLTEFQRFFQQNSDSWLDAFQDKEAGPHLILQRNHSFLSKGLKQTAGYMDTCGAAEGYLLLFDRREDKSWDERIWVRHRTMPAGRMITVWGV